MNYEQEKRTRNGFAINGWNDFTKGIDLIEQGVSLMPWNNPEQLNDKLNALEGIFYELVKECTQTSTAETFYLEISSD